MSIFDTDLTGVTRTGTPGAIEAGAAASGAITCSLVSTITDSSTDSTGYTRTGVSYSTDDLMIVVVENKSSAAQDPTGVTINGNAMTERIAGGVDHGVNNLSFWYWVATGTSSGSVVVTFGSAADNVVAHILRVQGDYDTTTPIVQDTSGTGTSTNTVSATLSAFSDSANATLAVFGIYGT